MTNESKYARLTGKQVNLVRHFYQQVEALEAKYGFQLVGSDIVIRSSTDDLDWPFLASIDLNGKLVFDQDVDL